MKCTMNQRIYISIHMIDKDQSLSSLPAGEHRPDQKCIICITFVLIVVISTYHKV
jgi:hypothetical protein